MMSYVNVAIIHHLIDFIMLEYGYGLGNIYKINFYIGPDKYHMEQFLC